MSIRGVQTSVKANPRGGSKGAREGRGPPSKNSGPSVAPNEGYDKA